MAGSVIGHGISNMLFGGRSAEAPPPAEYAQQAQQVTGNCDIPAKGEFWRHREGGVGVFRGHGRCGRDRFYQVPRSDEWGYGELRVLPGGAEYVASRSEGDGELMSTDACQAAAKPY